MEQTVDPEVSRAKFDREISYYRELEDNYISRGWFLLKADFPEMFVVFAAPQLNPAPVVFGLKLDFTNYDLVPPSVRIVNPFTGNPYKAKELPEAARLLRKSMGNASPVVLPNIGSMVFQQVQGLMQFHDPEEVPFLCLEGVREYHEHPAHSGDSWMLYRGRGTGTLNYILSNISKYGVESIKGYTLGLTVNGLKVEAPE